MAAISGLEHRPAHTSGSGGKITIPPSDIKPLWRLWAVFVIGFAVIFAAAEFLMQPPPPVKHHSSAGGAPTAVRSKVRPVHPAGGNVATRAERPVPQPSTHYKGVLWRFDCASAQPSDTAVRLVCRDGEISFWDGQIENAYYGRMARLGPEDTNRLAVDQQAWLRRLFEECIIPTAVALSDAIISRYRACLLEQMKVRERDLAPW